MPIVSLLMPNAYYVSTINGYCSSIVNAYCFYTINAYCFSVNDYC